MSSGVGGSDGPGVGGGVYIVAGGMACADAATLITGNHASTSDDDVHGDLCPGGPGYASRRQEAIAALFAARDEPAQGGLPGLLDSTLL